MDAHGSRLLQALLRYKGQEIVPVTTSVLHLTPEELVAIATDSHGSHCVEAMLRADIGCVVSRTAMRVYETSVLEPGVVQNVNYVTKNSHIAHTQSHRIIDYKYSNSK